MIDSLSNICYAVALGAAAIVTVPLVSIEYEVLFEDYILPFIVHHTPDITTLTGELCYLGFLEWKDSRGAFSKEIINSNDKLLVSLTKLDHLDRMVCSGRTQ